MLELIHLKIGMQTVKAYHPQAISGSDIKYKTKTTLRNIQESHRRANSTHQLNSNLNTDKNHKT